MLIILFLVNRAARFCKAIKIAISFAKYKFSLSLSFSVAIYIAIRAVLEDLIVVVLQIALLILTILFFSNKHIATIIP
jgi:hypothetical protein